MDLENVCKHFSKIKHNGNKIIKNFDTTNKFYKKVAYA